MGGVAHALGKAHPRESRATRAQGAGRRSGLFKHRDSPYVVHFKHRDSPYVVHFKHRDSPYVVHFKPRDSPYV